RKATRGISPQELGQGLS
ncbi:rCG49554, partial [Rattus norvegicus]